MAVKVCEWTTGESGASNQRTYRLLSEVASTGSHVYYLEQKLKDGLGGDRWDQVCSPIADDSPINTVLYILADALKSFSKALKHYSSGG